MSPSSTEPLSFLSLLTGSFSSPAAGNPTVAMVESAYRHQGIDARYINCEVPPGNLADAVRGAVAMGWIGFNCSLPHKLAIIELLDQTAESAAIIGAVNCVVRDGKKLIGHNTDGQGFLQSLRTVADPNGQRVVIFGAGGASRAIAIESALAGASSITVVNRDVDRAHSLVDLLNSRTQAHAEAAPWAGAYAVPQGTTLVINATSVGLFPDINGRINLDVDTLSPNMIVADVIPNPPRTALIEDAEKRGCITLDGLGMLVSQAAIGIQLWTGIKVDETQMRQTLATIFDSEKAV